MAKRKRKSRKSGGVTFFSDDSRQRFVDKRAGGSKASGRTFAHRFEATDKTVRRGKKRG